LRASCFSKKRPPVKNYLFNTEVNLSEAAFKLEANTALKDVVGGVKAGVDLKAALRTAPSFRQKLQAFLVDRLPDLKNQVTDFVKEGVYEVYKRIGNDTKIVFIFDSLEQVRGSLSTQKSVLESVEYLFSTYSPVLKLPYLHCVYTVPPWLAFKMAGSLVDYVMLPSVRQWNNDETRSLYQPGWDSLRQVVLKRFGGTTENCQRVFGAPDAAGHYPLADRLIEVCGGHFRDLLLLCRETIIRAKALPVTEPVINAAILAVRSNFLPISTEDAKWLDEIGRLRSAVYGKGDDDTVARLTRLLDTHFVLYLTNGKEWYDIHPLIRDEIAAIVNRQQELSGANEPAT
jgi:hypothetical protein